MPLTLGYSTLPTFTSTQVGCRIDGTLVTNITATSQATYYDVASITLPAGVWILNSAVKIYFSGTPDAANYVIDTTYSTSPNTGNFTIGTFTYYISNPGSSYTPRSNLTAIVSHSSSTTYYYNARSALRITALKYDGLLMYATRIA